MTADNVTSLGQAPTSFFRRRSFRRWSGLPFQVLGRIGSGILVLWAAVTLSFISIQLAPGDIVSLLIGEQIRTPEVEAAIRAEWGLDRSIPDQYLAYLTRLLHGDFGRSYILQTDISSLVASQVLPTLKLTAAALAVAIIFAVASAILTAGKPISRSIASGLELTLISTPTFWLGILLLYVFRSRSRFSPSPATETCRHWCCRPCRWACRLGPYSDKCCAKVWSGRSRNPLR